MQMQFSLRISQAISVRRFSVMSVVPSSLARKPTFGLPPVAFAKSVAML
jgi:hypothetical protein